MSEFERNLRELEAKGLIRKVIVDGEEAWEATPDGHLVAGSLKKGAQAS